MRTAPIGIVLAGLTFIVGSACAQGINPQETRVAGDAAQALVKSDYVRTIELANQATVLDPKDPWPYYDRASALVGLKRTDEAVSTFKQAEALFGDDRWGRSISIFGRARAYKEAANCAESARPFQEYATYVRETDQAGATLALRYSRECAAPVQTAIGGGPKSR